MASISTDEKTGRRMVQFRGTDGKRRSIRLGKVPRKHAESLRAKVEELLSASITGAAPAEETSAWLAKQGGRLRQRLEEAGLARPLERRARPTLGDWLDHYISSKTDIAENTLRNYEQTRKSLLSFFGPGKLLDEITAGDAEEYRLSLHGKKLAAATIARRCKRARQFFTAAVKKELLERNPFQDVKCGVAVNRDRLRFIAGDEIERVIAACPSAEWRLIFALCRYAGLRCPSEVLSLQWCDVNWQRPERFTVHSAKTGRDRIVPVFSALLPYLQDCFDQAELGEPFVITAYRDTRQSLRTQALRIVRRAGLKPWPKIFQNLRASCETELAAEFPVQCVAEWLGHSPQVAMQHYLQVRESDFERATRPADTPGALHQRCSNRPQGAAKRCTTSEGETAESDICSETGKNTAPCDSTGPRPMPLAGSELFSVSTSTDSNLAKQPESSAATCAARGVDSGDCGTDHRADSRPDLQRLAEVWDTLPEEVKAELTAFAVDAAEINSKEYRDR